MHPHSLPSLESGRIVSQMPVLASYSKPEEAFLVASLLHANGIETEVRDADIINTQWMYSNAVGGVKVVVSDDDLERAREVLNLPPQGKGILICPHCGSQRVRLRELNLLTALSVAMGFLLPFSSRQVDCLDCKRSFPLKLN